MLREPFAPGCGGGYVEGFQVLNGHSLAAVLGLGFAQPNTVDAMLSQLSTANANAGLGDDPEPSSHRLLHNQGQRPGDNV